MMMNTTLDQLRGLKLVSMAQALQEQMQQSGISAMSFEERLALLVDREVHGRQDRRCAKLLKTARLKYPQAMIEDLDCRASRGIDRATVMSLTLGPWVRSGHAVLITGPTGVGKSWLGCALAQHACRQGHSAFYQRVPRLGEELRIRHANGTFTRWLDILKNTDVLVLDDWGLVGMDAQTRTDLLEMIDDRAGRKATVITSQLPIEHWHEWIGDATVADAMLDRIMQNHHRLTQTGGKRPAIPSGTDTPDLRASCPLHRSWTHVHQQPTPPARPWPPHLQPRVQSPAGCRLPHSRHVGRLCGSKPWHQSQHPAPLAA